MTIFWLFVKKPEPEFCWLWARAKKSTRRVSNSPKDFVQIPKMPAHQTRKTLSGYGCSKTGSKWEKVIDNESSSTQYVHKPWVILGNQVVRAQQTSMLNVYLEAQFRLLPYFKWQRQVGEERQIGWKSYRLFEVVLSTIPCHWALPMCSLVKDNRLS